jgi:hypothetical protein
MFVYYRSYFSDHIGLFLITLRLVWENLNYIHSIIVWLRNVFGEPRVIMRESSRTS